jgi:large subunit ribosomal protein L21
MYAVVTTGGKQYRVEAGSELVVERLSEEPGASITFDRVLLVGDGESVTVGTPTVDGATVTGTVLGEALGPKLIVFKFKQKVKYRRTTGHRQHLTRVRIDEISAGGKKAKAEKTTEKADAADATEVEKPKRARAAKAETAKAAEADTGDDKPKRARRTAKKAESEE